MIDCNGLYYFRWFDSIDCYGDYLGEIEGLYKVCLIICFGKYFVYWIFIYDFLVVFL